MLTVFWHILLARINSAVFIWTKTWWLFSRWLFTLRVLLITLVASYLRKKKCRSNKKWKSHDWWWFETFLFVHPHSRSRFSWGFSHPKSVEWKFNEILFRERNMSRDQLFWGILNGSKMINSRESRDLKLRGCLNKYCYQSLKIGIKFICAIGAVKCMVNQKKEDTYKFPYRK